MRHILLLAIVSYACIAEGMEQQQQQQQNPDQEMVYLRFFDDTTGSHIADFSFDKDALSRYFPEQDKLPRTGENGNIINITIPSSFERTQDFCLSSEWLNPAKIDRDGNLDFSNMQLQPLIRLLNITMALQADHLANKLVEDFIIPRIYVAFDYYLKGANRAILYFDFNLNEASKRIILESLRDKNNVDLNHHKTQVIQSLQRSDLEYQKIASLKVTMPSFFSQITFGKNDDSSILFTTRNRIRALNITPQNIVESQGTIIEEKPDSTITHFSVNRSGNTLAYAALNAHEIPHLHVLQKIENRYQEQQVLEIEQGRNEIVALAFHPTKETLLVGLGYLEIGSRILVLEKQSGQYVEAQRIETDFSALAWHPGKADTFAAGGHDGISVFTKTFNTDQYQLKQRIPHRYVHNLAFSKNPDSIIGLRGQSVAFMNADAQGNYNRTGGISVADLGRGNKPSIAIHPDQGSFILGSGNQILAYAPGVNKGEAYKIFELPKNQSIQTNSSVAFSPTGKYFAAITSEGDVLVGKHYTRRDALKRYSTLPHALLVAAAYRHNWLGSANYLLAYANGVDYDMAYKIFHLPHTQDVLKEYSTLSQAVLIAGAFRSKGLNIRGDDALESIYRSLNEGPLKGKEIQQMLTPLLYAKNIARHPGFRPDISNHRVWVPPMISN